MSDFYGFGVHGTAVQPEYSTNGLRISRRGDGTLVSQNNGTHNWFHFAVPTPILADGEKLSVRGMYLTLAVNENATVDIVRLHRGWTIPGEPPPDFDNPNSPPIWRSDGDGPPPRTGSIPFTSTSGTYLDIRIDDAPPRDGAIRRTDIRGALGVSAHVLFTGGASDGDVGRVLFMEAGISAETQ